MNKNIICFHIIMLLSITSALAFNNTELSEITNVTVPAINNNTDSRANEIIGELDAVQQNIIDSIINHSAIIGGNQSNITVKLNQQQLREIIKNLSVQNDFVCNGVYGGIFDNQTNGTFSDGFQLALERAISNEMDRKNRDMQDWFEVTLLPSVAEQNACTNELTLKRAEIEDLNELMATRDTANQNALTICGRDVEIAKRDRDTIAYVCIAVIFLFLLSNINLIKRMVNKE